MPSVQKQRLEAKRRHFAALIVQGWTITDAWRQVTPRPDRIPAEYHHDHASKYAADAKVKVAVTDALKAASPSDLDTPGEHMRRILDDHKAARSAEHHSAVATQDALLARIHGMVIDRTFNLSVTGRLSEADLLERLAGGDPLVLERLRKRLPGPDFEEDQD